MAQLPPLQPSQPSQLQDLPQGQQGQQTQYIHQQQPSPPPSATNAPESSSSSTLALDSLPTPTRVENTTGQQPTSSLRLQQYSPSSIQLANPAARKRTHDGQVKERPERSGGPETPVSNATTPTTLHPPERHAIGLVNIAPASTERTPAMSHPPQPPGPPRQEQHQPMPHQPTRMSYSQYGPPAMAAPYGSYTPTSQGPEPYPGAHAGASNQAPALPSMRSLDPMQHQHHGMPVIPPPPHLQPGPPYGQYYSPYPLGMNVQYPGLALGGPGGAFAGGKPKKVGLPV